MSTWVVALVCVVGPVRAVVRGRVIARLAREFRIWRWRRLRPREPL